MGLAIKDDGWRLSNELWARMEPLLPVHTARPHPLGCHRRRMLDRAVREAILFVLRTGCQWNALDATGICSCGSAYRRFREWLDADVFEAFWREGLLEYDRLKGIDWSWLSVDGAMTKAPLGGEKTGPNPTDRGKGGVKRSLMTEGSGIPLSVVTPPTSAPGVRRRRRSNARRASRRAAGWPSAPTAGSTASAGCSCAGQNAPTPTSPCSTSRSVSSPGEPTGSTAGRDRLHRDRVQQLPAPLDPGLPDAEGD